MKTTKWFDVSTPPVREGVYQRRCMGPYGHAWYFSYWDGARWGFSASSPEKAAEHRGFASTYVTGKWRGLTEQAK